MPRLECSGVIMAHYSLGNKSETPSQKKKKERYSKRKRSTWCEPVTENKSPKRFPFTIFLFTLLLSSQTLLMGCQERSGPLLMGHLPGAPSLLHVRTGTSGFPTAATVGSSELMITAIKSSPT